MAFELDQPTTPTHLRRLSVTVEYVLNKDNVTTNTETHYRVVLVDANNREVRHSRDNGSLTDPHVPLTAQQLTGLQTFIDNLVSSAQNGFGVI